MFEQAGKRGSDAATALADIDLIADLELSISRRISMYNTNARKDLMIPLELVFVKAKGLPPFSNDVDIRLNVWQ